MPLPANHTFVAQAPDWRGGIADTPSVLTTIADSLTGAEDRAAWWTRPRRSLRYLVTPRTVEASVQATEALRLARTGGRASVPHWGRGNVLTAFTASSDLGITASRVHGLAAGDMVAIHRPGDALATLREVATTPTTSTLTLTSAIPAGWAGTVWLARVLHGRVDEPSWTRAGQSGRRSLNVNFTEFPVAPAPAANWLAEATDVSHLWGPPPRFVLYLCLDETGSIGEGGAQRGLDLITLYADRIAAIGFCSFGDAIRKNYAITASVSTVADYLQDVVDGVSPAVDEFFGDDGGDTPENGVDALAAAVAAHAAYVSDLPRLVALKTDTWGFAHQAASPATVLAGLTALDGVWLEFNRNGSPDGTSYAATFPQTTKLRHSPFPDPI